MSHSKAIAMEQRRAAPRAINTAVYVVFTASILLSAGLIFMVQPMFGKMALPLLGGTPGVWNTAMVFFQASLLAGYCYAHVLSKLKFVRLQQVIHLVVMASATAVLPLTIGAGWMRPPDGTPTLWLLALLAANVGAPFFALSANSPLIQKWFSKTSHAHASDPYFLYAASNLGSFIGLLSYPLLIEPSFSLPNQAAGWFCGYLALMVLLFGAALLTARMKLRPNRPLETVASASAGTISWAQRRRWLFLSAVPSALLLAVTTYITTDLVAIPLLWVIPLALYLLTLAIVFAKRPIISHKLMMELQPFCVIAALLTMNVLDGIPVTILGGIAIAAYFTTTMVAHRRLADERPDAAHLTEFYIFMSLGGVIGGSLVALVAPVVFNSIVEYPALLILGLLTRPLKPSRTRLDLYVPAFICLMVLGTDFVFDIYGLADPYTIAILVLFVLGTVSAGASCVRIVLLGVAASVFSMVSIHQAGMPQTVHQVRSFFGVHKVRESTDGSQRQLLHGTTVHGMQSLVSGEETQPLLYYDRKAGGGRVIAAMAADDRLSRVGAIGLGAGALSCYAQPGQDWTFFEIDSHVISMSTGDGFFTLMSRCAPGATIIQGDGRLTLARQTNQSFDLLVLDAFSSDAIPLHLLTREAVGLYLQKLRPDGVLLLHISNRFLDPEPAIAALGQDAGLTVKLFDYIPSDTSDKTKTGSTWVAMSADTAFIESLRPTASTQTEPNAWRKPRLEPGFRVWTDTYSNVLAILR
ncbi:MAG: fused MFS/spermidine synthase [Pseudomonadota bacterium]